MRNWLAMLSLAALVAGCSTPQSRIEKHPEIFNALSPDVQANVREGKIDIGYSQDAVMLALGEPARIYVRKTAAGESTVWSYVDRRYSTDRQHVAADVPGYDMDGRRRVRREFIWVDVQKAEEFEKLRVEFMDGKVSAIESVNR